MVQAFSQLEQVLGERGPSVPERQRRLARGDSRAGVGRYPHRSGARR
jgi:hypothetical protein